MSTYIILGLVAGLPLILALILRVSAIYYFLSVAAGLLLVQYIADSTELALNTFVPHSNFSGNVKLALILIPVLLTFFFLRKTVQSSKLLLHLVPIALTSAILGIFIINNLPNRLQTHLLANPIGKIANNSINVLIAATTAITLILAWLTLNHHKVKSKHH